MAFRSQNNKGRLKYLEYFRDKEFKQKQESLNNWLQGHKELLGQGVISPRVFQRLVDEQLEPVIVARTHLMQQLSRIWDEYWGQPNTPESEETKRELQLMSDAGTVARNKYQDLLKDVVAIVTQCAPRVNWRKHGKKSYRRKLVEWIDEKCAHHVDLVDLDHNDAIKPELEVIRDMFNHATIRIPRSPVSQSPNGAITGAGQNKRPYDNDDSEDGPLPPSKKPRQQLLPGQWWGPNNSRLNPSDAFSDVIRQYKAYRANPPDEPGTAAHMEKMTGFLRQALSGAGLRPDNLNDLLLKSEWNFRDPDMGHVRVPNFIKPGASESEDRLGSTESRGFNDFKTMLGGGLTAAEESFGNRTPTPFLGMVALAHSSRSVNDSISLRGGKSNDADNAKDGGNDNNNNNNNKGDGDDNSVVEKNTRIRQWTHLRFRDPSDLWEQLLADVEYPSDVFRSRVEDHRPPMIDPDRGGTAVTKHQNVMSSIPLPDEWDAILEEKDTDVLEEKAEGYLKALIESRQSAHAFVHSNPGHIFPSEPTLNQPGGRDRPVRRYKSLRSRDFAAPIGETFRARMYQVLRLAIYWRFYQLDLITLKDLLREEKLHLEIWDQHEEMYMEWENHRFFTLKSSYEISELRNRYNARELLRKVWENERTGIDKVIEQLDEDPHYYDNKAPSPEPSTAWREPEATLQDSSSEDLKSGGLGTAATSQPKSSTRATVTFHEDEDALPDPVYDPIEPSGQEAGIAETQNAHNADNDNDTNIVNDNNTGVVQKQPTFEDGRDLAVRICEMIRDAYEAKRKEVKQENDDLDIYDPGNQPAIYRNNVDLMAKQQVIWGLNIEIHNLRRSVDPLAPGSIGRGAAHRWQLPGEEDYTMNTRPIPPRPQLALGVTSLGLGPMPGEHPSVTDPRIFVGAHPSFGRSPDADVEMETMMMGRDAAAPRPPTSTTTGTITPPLPPEVPSQIDHIPKDWDGLIALHRESLTNDLRAPSGTAALGWDDWTEAVFQALLASVRGLRVNFPSGSPYGGTDEDLRRHVQHVYRRSFGGVANHNSVPWDEREKHRHVVLEEFASDVNAALRESGLPANFPGPGISPPSPSPSSPPAVLAAQQATDHHSSAGARPQGNKMVLAGLRKYQMKRNQAKETIAELTKIQKSSAHGLSARQQRALDQAKKSRREYRARYKRLRADADAVTRAQADAAAETTSTLGYESHEDTAAATELDLDDEATEVGTTELEKAEENVKKVAAALEASREKVEKAASDAAAAQEAAMSTGDSYLEALSAIADQAKAEANEELHCAVANFRLAGEALRAQQAWHAPAASTEELRGRLAAVNQGLDTWADQFVWDTWVLDGRNAMDQWIVEVGSFVHEAYKAIGLAMTVQHWYDLYDDFWATRGTSLVRMRALWLFSLVAVLNRNIEILDLDVDALVPTPPQLPPVEWQGDPPPKAELLRQADAELAPVMAQNTFVKSVPSPKPPAVTALKADSPTETTSSSKKKNNVVVLDPSPSPDLDPRDSPSKARRTAGSSNNHNHWYQYQYHDNDHDHDHDNGYDYGYASDNAYNYAYDHDYQDYHEDDAWPDLKDLLQATWNSVVAHEALNQQPGDRWGVPSGRPLWPAPVRVQADRPEPHEYYSL
ncbi:hypothetical protein F5Y14DRAFT_457775 [Nemania sp. NC0429]|nr:hypothetical protein F5Y14DRAFT_457775 [Nemania sp. NC0429]